MIITVVVSLTLICLALIGAIIFLQVKHQQEKADLQDRLAAKSIEEYKYYRLGYPTEVQAAKDKNSVEIEEQRLRDEAKRRAEEEFLKRKGGIEAFRASRGF